MIKPSFLDAILVDEVGIESGSCGGFLLKSAYRPVFSPLGDKLMITAFDAYTQIQRDGEICRPGDFLDASPGVDDDFLDGLCQTLHVSNHRNLSLPGHDLVIDHELSHNRRLRDTLLDAARQARAVGEPGLEAVQVICRVTGAAQFSAGDRSRLLGELREAGMRIILDAFDEELGVDPDLRFRPDIAEVTGAWLAKIASEAAAARLLRPLIDAHRREGTRVMIRGISGPDHLRLAIDAGAEYLAGDYLSPPLAVGALVDDEPRSIERLLQPSRPETSVRVLHQRR